MDVCVTVLLLVTVCVPELSVVTTDPNMRYLVLAKLVNGALGAVMVLLVLSYTAVPTVALKLVM